MCAETIMHGRFFFFYPNPSILFSLMYNLPTHCLRRWRLICLTGLIEQKGARTQRKQQPVSCCFPCSQLWFCTHYGVWFHDPYITIFWFFFYVPLQLTVNPVKGDVLKTEIIHWKGAAIIYFRRQDASYSQQRSGPDFASRGSRAETTRGQLHQNGKM